MKELIVIGMLNTTMEIFLKTYTPSSGRPLEFDEERLNQLFHTNSHLMTREMAEKNKCPKSI